MNQSASILRSFILLSTGALLPMVNGAQLAFAPSGASAHPVTTLQVELGTRFSVAEPLALAGLAYYDFGSDGFAIAHPVTLWDDVGNLIASVTVSSGSATIGPAFGGGQFRLENIALTLNPGTYRLSGALAPINWGNPVPDPDPVLYDNSSPSGDTPWAIPGITYLGRVYAPDGTGAGTFPSLQVTSADADDWFGPNLVVANQVPEPSTAILVLLAIAAAWRSRRCVLRRQGRHEGQVLGANFERKSYTIVAGDLSPDGRWGLNSLAVACSTRNSTPPTPSTHSLPPNSPPMIRLFELRGA